MRRWGRIICVTCPTCGEFDEEKVEFVGISEDMQGRDRMTFVCPKCGKTVTSYRR